MKNVYENLAKNTVKAENQLKESQLVRFYNPEGKGKRIVFIGNSITLHGKKPDIGWNFEHGMAASAPENDYVHLLMSKINAVAEDSAFCICQVADWERSFSNGSSTFGLFEGAAAFNADILIVRFSENCPADNFDSAVFKREVKKLLDYLSTKENKKIIITTSFWHHPADPAFIELAEELGTPLVQLGDLGERDDMKAIGLFEHAGVANHPGDLGMKNIAERIFEAVKAML